MIDFEIARRTGLRQKGELERLFGVSYPMTNAYMQGKSYPRGPNRAHIEVVMKVLAGLLESGKLPFADGKDSESRAKAIGKIVAYVKAKKSK